MPRPMPREAPVMRATGFTTAQHNSSWRKKKTILTKRLSCFRFRLTTQRERNAMKKLPALFIALMALAANAQPAGSEDLLQANSARPAKETTPAVKEGNPNEIKAGRLTYSGIAVEAGKTDNLLQLINPA